jgi:hypothetical protein
MLSAMLAGVAAVVVACAESAHRASGDDAYQACLDRGRRYGDLGVADPMMRDREYGMERSGLRSGFPSRSAWPKSIADECSDLRARGRL